MKLSLQPGEQTASSYHLRLEYYLYITWKPAKYVKAVLYQVSKAADNCFKKVQFAYLAVISYLDKLLQPSYTLPMQTSPLAYLPP